jgi:hypothetical protein
MATYISNGTGDWNTASTWLTAAGGSFIPTGAAGNAPQSGGGDKIVIRRGHTVLYNVNGEFGDDSTYSTNLSSAGGIVVVGTLSASRTTSTSLTARGSITVPAGGTFDWGTVDTPIPSSINHQIVLNYSASSPANMKHIFVSNGGNVSLYSGLQKTRNTFLTLSADTGDTQITVNDATNWDIGDRVILESDTTSVTREHITTISNVAGNVINLNTVLNFARLSGTRIGNFSSNITIRPHNNSFTTSFQYIPNNTSTCVINNVRFEHLGSNSGTISWGTTEPYNGPAAQSGLGIFATNLLNDLTIENIAIEEIGTPGLFLYSVNYPSVGRVTLKNSALRGASYGAYIGSGSIPIFDRCTWYRTAYLNLGFGAGSGNTLITDSFINASAEPIRIVGKATVNNTRLRTPSAIVNNSVLDTIFNNCTLQADTRFVNMQGAGALGTNIFNNCIFTGTAPLTAVSTIRSSDLQITKLNRPNNVDGDYRLYNYYYYGQTNSTVRKNGITSLRIKPNIANQRFNTYLSIPALAGVSQRIECNLRFDSTYGTANPPSISFVGAGVNQTFTCPAVADTWHNVDLTLNPTSTDDITVTISGQSASILGFVYLDGLPIDPYIQNARWYGFETDKNAYRTIDANTTLTENQVSAYPYINNLDYVYDESRYWTVTNPASSSYIDLLNNVGKTLDFSNRGILLNSAALLSLNFDSNTNILTLSTFSLSAGNNFNAIQTTGGITVNDNSNISSITLIGSVSGTTARNLNGVIIDGTLTYNTNVDTLIAYTNCNIGTVQNNGSGIVTINRLNSNVDVAGNNIVLLDNPTYINISNLLGGYVAIFDNTGTLRYYTNSNDQIILPNGSTGTWTYKVGRFQSRLITGSFSIGGTVNINPSYVQDLNVETNVTVASAYNTFRNTQQVYDYFSYYMTTSAALSYPQFYNYRTILDITDKNLILNPSASIPFEYDGTTFTIKSQNLENGSIVKGVETTGNIYLSGSASLSAINIISDKINSESVVSLNSVNAAASDIVYNTNSASSIVYTNCTIDKVENLGSGDVTIKKLNSTITDGTDAQILDYYPTFLNLSLNAGTIAIYDDAQTRQYFTSTNQTIELPYEADGPWTYRVTRYGQRTVEGNFTVNRVIGNTFDITPTFQPDINILNTANSVSAYSTFTSIQSIYDYMSYYKTTTNGIDFGDLTNVGSILDIGNRSLILDISSPLLLSVTSNSITLSTNSLSAGDGSIVNSLKTTNKVFLSGNSTLKNMSVQGSINQEIISNLYGMTVDGTIRYYVNTPTSITYTNCNVNNVINDGNSLVTITRINSIITNETDDEVETVVPISINITVDSDTYVAIYKPDESEYYYGSGNKTLLLGGDAVTGNWTCKVAKYGHVLYTTSFTIDKDISSVNNINPTLVIDSSITEANVNTVIAYTDLNTSRKIYDYLSYYKTTSDGIRNGTISNRAIGSIILTTGLTLDNTATSIVDISSNILTVKSSGLNEEITIYLSDDFTTNVDISQDVKIRATNIDSELELIGVDKITLYSSLANRDADINNGPEITSSIYRFKYGSTVSGGVILQGTQYARAVISSSVLLTIFELNAGNNLLDLGTFGQIQQILNNQVIINDGIKKSSRLIPHSTNL